MKMSVESLRQKMEQTYFEATGYGVDSESDVGLRFQMFAAELYSLYLYGSFVLEQAFPQTAAGRYLDLHASGRGLFRRTASCASGSLSFSVENPAAAAIDIPVGTVCACKDNPHIRFTTTSTGVLSAGETKTSVPALAAGKGESYNVKAGAIDLMVTPPAGIAFVTNPRSFSGGYRGENDEALRSRLLEQMQFFPNGFNRQSYIDRLTALEDIVDANVFCENGREDLVVVIRSKMQIMPNALCDQVRALLSESLLVPVNLLLADAVQRKVGVKLVVMLAPGYSKETVVQAVKNAVASYSDGMRIGEPFYPAKLLDTVRGIEGVKAVTLRSGETPVAASPSEYLGLSPLEVTTDEW